MTEYELFYLIGESKEVDLARIKDEVKTIVHTEGGEYIGEEKIEKRKLAYAVKREVRGTYIAQRFTTPDKNGREARTEAGEGSFIAAINHKLNLYRDVLRFMIVRAKGLPALIEEETASKVVAEVTKEAHDRKVAVEKKSVRKPIQEAPVQEAVTEKVAVEKKKTSKATSHEVDLDKQLEEVLHI